MIKALILDYGNVISKTSTKDVDAALAAETGIPVEVFGTIYSAHRGEFDRGIISGEEMYRRLLQENGYEKEASDEALFARRPAIKSQ